MPESNAGSAPGTTAFDAGVAAFEAGNFAAAKELIAGVLRDAPTNVDAQRFAGVLSFSTGDFPDALGHFEEARRLDPGNPLTHFDSAVTHFRLNDLDAAQRRCETALALDPSLEAAHVLLASLRLRGPGYLEVLAAIHRHLRPRTYMEIGVETGLSLALALPETRSIGVDPEPKISMALGPRASVVAERSDDYFARHDVRAELDGLPIEVAFIDGMHWFEFALRDFINVEKRSSPRSTILVHDCYPLNRLTAERERKTHFWSGDIWRLVLLLRKHRPDLSVNVIATAPTGLCLVRRLDPHSRVLEERYDSIVQESLALDYSVLDTDKAGMLALYPNDWEKIKSLLQ
jgi:Tetratricopeptide repeat/Methyltransferase domain